MSGWAAIILSRVGQATATALVLATLCFAATHLLPGDLALQVAAARVGEDRVTPELATRLSHEEGLAQPLMRQYVDWLTRLSRGDLGRSLVSRKPVWDEVAYHARFTVVLASTGWALSYVIALPLGAAAGLRPDGVIDRLSAGVSVALASLPTFIVGVGLISVFALTLRWLPPAGSRTAAHMVLPALTLALGLAAFSLRIVRNAVVEVRAAFYMTFASIRGLSARAAFRHHGTRNAAVPVVVFAAVQLAILVDGFVVVETLFSYPGIGELLIKALIARDVPIIMGVGLLLGFLNATLNMVADLVALRLDPRRGARAAWAGTRA